ncbi:MAG: phospholipase D-like domain-containing protein [Desulfobacterota bacterium]|nr:phospholipase D-like domain-containing protein [Thermodesulfobacteriota bacterium]
MRKSRLALLTLWLIAPFFASPVLGLPAEDVQVVTDAQYFEVARKMIREARSSLLVMMFEMGYYEKYPQTPSNLLIKELIEAKKRGVRVEVVLEAREGDDRTTKRNRQTGKILSEGGVEVTYDPLFKTMHAKALVADGEWALVGSTNWVFSSLTSNNEVSVLIKSKEVARALTDYFHQLKASGSPSQKRE